MRETSKNSNHYSMSWDEGVGNQHPVCVPAGATELSQLFRNLGAPLSYEKVADVFMRYDKDESGQIEFGEFLLMFQVRDAPHRSCLRPSLHVVGCRCYRILQACSWSGWLDRAELEAAGVVRGGWAGLEAAGVTTMRTRGLCQHGTLWQMTCTICV
jgi:hypothetical protein